MGRFLSGCRLVVFMLSKKETCCGSNSQREITEIRIRVSIVFNGTMPTLNRHLFGNERAIRGRRDSQPNSKVRHHHDPRKKLLAEAF